MDSIKTWLDKNTISIIYSDQFDAVIGILSNKYYKDSYKIRIVIESKNILKAYAVLAKYKESEMAKHIYTL